MIDPTARIEDGAAIGSNVSIGPYCTVGANVTLGDGCRLVAHVNVSGHTAIGARTVIYPFASLGSPPQSVKYRGGPTRLTVGADCDIREGVTMSTGTEDDGGLTEVGNSCFIMVGSHVGHDCKVGDNVTFANNVLLAGHVVVGDNVVFGGGVGVRQFVRIGKGAMIAALSGVGGDIIPYGIVESRIGRLVGLNVVGMRRRGIAKADIHRYRNAYEALFFGEGEFQGRLDRIAKDFSGDPQVAEMLEFIRGGKRPLAKAVKRGQAGEVDEDA